MNAHDINRIENALFVLLQYRDNDKITSIISDVLQFDGLTTSEFFDRLEEIKIYF